MLNFRIDGQSANGGRILVCAFNFAKDIEEISVQTRVSAKHSDDNVPFVLEDVGT